MNVLLSKDTSDISQPVTLKSQLTFVAFGLEGTDEVSFEVVLLSAPLQAGCQCPPGQVVMPSVAQSFPLTCCGEPIKLTESNPFVIIDAPQGFMLRALWNVLPTEGQVVMCEETATPNLNGRLRGCPCEDLNNVEQQPAI